MDCLNDPRFKGIEKFESKVWLSPAQYDETEEWVKEYIEQFGAEPSFF